MGSIAFIKIISELFPIKKTAEQPAQPLWKKSPAGEKGFTLLELLVVVLIIGVLSTIAAPSWLAFLNRQRVSKFNDAVFSSIQKAQQEARRTKLSYSVAFRVNLATGVPESAVYIAKDASGNPMEPNTMTPSPWKSLNADLELKPGQVWLGTNLRDVNQAGPAPLQRITTRKTITFDYQGRLDQVSTLNLGNKGLIIAVAVPRTGDTNNPIVSTRRCVKIKTLLGSIQTGQDTECNPD